jgi:hypothetical protein
MIEILMILVVALMCTGLVALVSVLPSVDEDPDEGPEPSLVTPVGDLLPPPSSPTTVPARARDILARHREDVDPR